MFFQNPGEIFGQNNDFQRKSVAEQIHRVKPTRVKISENNDTKGKSENSLSLKISLSFTGRPVGRTAKRRCGTYILVRAP